jgi:phage terminase large subunit-like protein
MLLSLPSSTSSVLDVSSVRGSTLPRLYTPPLVTGPPGPCGCGCALTEETSVGFEQVEFADVVLGHPLDPWQRWLAVHAGELLPDGTPRFSVVLVLVSRQNGKTEVLVVLSLWWLFVQRVPLVLGTSTKLDYAKESWRKAVKLARKVPDLADEIPKRGGVRETNGEQELATVDDCRYKIAASNAEGGRSLSIDRLVLDELRQHHNYEAWDALEPTTSARPGSQIWALSNAGSDKSVVLNDKRADALAFIETGEGDDDLGLFEWSSPEDADPTDLAALRQGNPNLGHRKDAKKLLANARRAVARGGEALTGFKTEHMCIRVKLLDPAIDPGKWRDCKDVGDLADARSRLAVCVDLSPSGDHATLAAAAVLENGRVRVETVHEWTGPGAATALERELPGWVEKLKPKVLGWFPAGPAAAVAAKVADRRKAGVTGWPPRGVTVEEIRGEVTAVCMGFAKEVTAGTLAHSGQAMPDAQVGGAEKLKRGDAWVFTRSGGGNVDAVYAEAGATHLARTLPKPRNVSRRMRSAQ